ncbi:unnamed protein product [Rotaria socialis]|nr:unnamed protein product [Rotaria socialis]CAF3334332.1 unnamed protein product [Rotaria socialis]CAF3586222.1 unnamed protein product [Rotaria socialis]CAF3742112.1 unnamed protein product [Rotaria socialis]CAF4473960.1 unnamed protein product [Rotaria socialis]
MKIISNSLKIISIDQIKNPFLEDAYKTIKKIISKQCSASNPNERLLFHGTSLLGIIGITEDGFDDRFFNAGGAWGYGSYFADNPRKSHGFTALDVTDQTRVMFYSKVLLGKESIQNTTNNALVSAPQGHPSVRGTAFQYAEYIVYRYGQALPYLKIVYKD